jgi:hypothetical protein
LNSASLNRTSTDFFLDSNKHCMCHQLPCRVGTCAVASRTLGLCLPEPPSSGPRVPHQLQNPHLSHTKIYLLLLSTRTHQYPHRMSVTEYFGVERLVYRPDKVGPYAINKRVYSVRHDELPHPTVHVYHRP